MAEVSLAAAAATPSVPSIAGAGVAASTAPAPPFADLLTALADPTGVATAAGPILGKTIAPPITLSPDMMALPDGAAFGIEPRVTPAKPGADDDRASDGLADATPARPMPTPDLSAFLALIAAPAQAIATSPRPLVAAEVGIATARATRTFPAAPAAPVGGPATTSAALLASNVPARADTPPAPDGTSAPLQLVPAAAMPMSRDPADATSPGPSAAFAGQTASVARTSLPLDVTAIPAPVSSQVTEAAVAAAAPAGAVTSLTAEPPRDATPRADASPAQDAAIASDAPPPPGRTATLAAPAPSPDPTRRTRTSLEAPAVVESASAVPAASPAAPSVAAASPAPRLVDDAVVPPRATLTGQAEPKAAATGGGEQQRPATSHAHRSPEPPRIADVRIDPTVPRVALAAAATTRIADDPVARQLSIAQDGQWLDALTRDIASAGNADGQLRFRLDPDHLGSLTVQITQGSDGASIRLTASTEAARTILADAQPRLVAEARAQGLTLRDATVETRGAAPAPATATPASSGAGFSGGGGGGGRGDQGGVAAQLHQQSQQQGGNRPRAPEPARQANLAPRDSTSTRSGADLYA